MSFSGTPAAHSPGLFFFDEIAETTPSFQAKLLRAIQEGEVRRVGENKPITIDIRVVAATNVDLSLAVEERRFRQDFQQVALAQGKAAEVGGIRASAGR